MRVSQLLRQHSRCCCCCCWYALQEVEGPGPDAAAAEVTEQEAGGSGTDADACRCPHHQHDRCGVVSARSLLPCIKCWETLLLQKGMPRQLEVSSTVAGHDLRSSTWFQH
jgi:hypothetical protein